MITFKKRNMNNSESFQKQINIKREHLRSYRRDLNK